MDSGGWWIVDGWDTEAFLDVKKNNLFGNISESTRQVFLIVSTPHRRVLKTSLGMFRIGKIGNFSNPKILSNLVFDQISRYFEDQKISFSEIY